MKESYFPKEGIWLKGNIHSHSTVTDGSLSPEELVKLYKAKGYDFLSITDHNVYVEHHHLSDNEFLLITGLEHDIKYSEDKCIHVVGNVGQEKEDTGYCCRLYSASELEDQQLIDMMYEDGQFVSLAHPVWSRMEPEEVLKLKNIHAIEVFNNGTEHLCHAGNAELYWDLLLRHGKHVFATAVDDVHGKEDLFGGWICVKASEFNHQAIMNALFHGEFYASSGPELFDFGIEENRIYVSCSECREIHFVSYPPRGESFFADGETPLKSAVHTLTGREEYVRIVCVDKNGHSAWSNPVFLKKE